MLEISVVDVFSSFCLFSNYLVPNNTKPMKLVTNGCKRNRGKMQLWGGRRVGYKMGEIYTR